jgi:hypothetical protein
MTPWSLLADLGSWLDQHAGVAQVLVAALYTVITLLLVLESRRGRLAQQRAEVVAYATLWEEAGVYVAVRLDNLGPGHARDVVLTFWLEQPDGFVLQESRRRLAEGFYPSGRHRTFLPSPTGPLVTLTQLAEWGVRLVLRWAWRDSSRRLAVLPRRHHRQLRTDLATMATDMYGGSALVERDAIDSLPEIVARLAAIDKTLEGIERPFTEQRLRRIARSAVRARAAATSPAEDSDDGHGAPGSTDDAGQVP